MRRPMAVAATMVLLLTLLAIGQDRKSEFTTESTAKSKQESKAISKQKSNVAPKEKKVFAKKAETPEPEFVMETFSRCGPGDKCVIYRHDGRAVVAATDLSSFGELSKFDNAKDAEGLIDLVRKGRAIILDKGTRVLSIKIYDNKYSLDFVGTEIRVLDGEYKDKKLFVQYDYVRRLIEKPINAAEESVKKAKANAERSKARAQTPEGRAASLLSVAKNLEKSGKAKPALENYRKVVAEFGDTPSAKEAGERIKVLGGK